MTLSEQLKYFMDGKVSIMLHSRYHGWWWPGDAWSQGINSNGIDPIITEYSGHSTRAVTITSLLVRFMGPTRFWGREDPGGPHVGPHEPCYLIWDYTCYLNHKCQSLAVCEDKASNTGALIKRDVARFSTNHINQTRDSAIISNGLGTSVIPMFPRRLGLWSAILNLKRWIKVTEKRKISMRASESPAQALLPVGKET